MRKCYNGKEVRERQQSGSKWGAYEGEEGEKHEIFVDTSINEALSCDSV